MKIYSFLLILLLLACQQSQTQIKSYEEKKTSVDYTISGKIKVSTD
tara:strand:+ start:737 stop:874 length:138 start_codon:yes stop_codon:yes gene_type:complete